MDEWGVDDAFVVFDEQDSGCLSWGVEREGERWFVKTATNPMARASLSRAVALHSAVRHEVLVGPEHVMDGLDGITLVYPWRPGRVLNHATVGGSDRNALKSFQRLPLEQVQRAVDQILNAHVAIAAAGWVAGDLYDGCFLYDEVSERMIATPPWPISCGSGRRRLIREPLARDACMQSAHRHVSVFDAERERARRGLWRRPFALPSSRFSAAGRCRWWAQCPHGGQGTPETLARRGLHR